MDQSCRARLAAAGVSSREAEVLAAVGARLTNAEIAARLFISVRTVESHVSALLRKLEMPDRQSLIRVAGDLAAQPAAAPPVPPTSFVGRESELARIDELLADARVVSLAGPAGCGKTRLAAEAARRWRGEARICDLAAASAAGVHDVIAAALGLSYEAADLVAAGRVALAGRDLLLVADTCDHVIEQAGQALSALAAAVPGLRMLATSRQPPGISGEHVLVVRPLPAPGGDDPEAVRASAAGRLFIDRALAASGDFVLDGQSAAHVAAICRSLDGLPLAIELAAARLRSIDVRALAESLNGRLPLLEQRVGPGRHRSLGAAIAWSWDLLDEAERALLGRLAALPGEFTLALAEAVSPRWPAGEVRSTLLSLVDKSLVSAVITGAGPARYRLLGVVAAFAAEREPAPAWQVRRLHAGYLAGLAEQEALAHRQALPAAPPPFDEPNYLAALTWAAARDPELADRLLGSLAVLIELHPSRRAIEVICEVAGRPGADLSSESLAKAAVAATYLNLDTALDLAGRGSARARGEKDRAYAAWASGWAHAYRHDEAAALASLDQVIGYARGAGERWLEASAWQARGLARAAASDAFADWERAVPCFVAAGDMMHASNVRYMLASRAVEAGERLGDVPVWLDACEAFAASNRYRHELAHIDRVRSVYERTAGRTGRARMLAERALPVFRQAGDLRCAMRTLLEIAVHHLAGDPAAAAALLTQGAAIAAVAGDPALGRRILARLAAAAAAAGDLPLGARALGALDASDADSGPRPDGEAGTALVPREVASVLRAPACSTFIDEGRAGGIGLIAALYPAGLPGSSAASPRH